MEVPLIEEQPPSEILRDNLILDPIIVVGTKALRRGLMSGETLRAPRQQLRRLRASAFDLLRKSPAIARFFGARSFFWFFCQALGEPPFRPSQSQFLLIQKTVQVIRKNLAPVIVASSTEEFRDSDAAFCFFPEKLVA
jgi:hypothetical protein